MRAGPLAPMSTAALNGEQAGFLIWLILVIPKDLFNLLRAVSSAFGAISASAFHILLHHAVHHLSLSLVASVLALLLPSGWSAFGTIGQVISYDRQ